jgi:hypothetical protein
MNTFLRIVFIVVVAAVIIGAGIAIFNAGMVQGAAMSGQLSDGAAPATPYYAPYYGPWGFWWFPGFLCFGLFGLFLLFGLGRMIFGPRRWGYGRRGWGGPWGSNGEQVPPQVEELHRRMHEKMNQPPTTQV